MYCRVVNVKALSELQMKMIIAYIETTMFPRNLGAGQMSGEVFSISQTRYFRFLGSVTKPLRIK